MPFCDLVPVSHQSCDVDLAPFGCSAAPAAQAATVPLCHLAPSPHCWYSPLIVCLSPCFPVHTTAPAAQVGTVPLCHLALSPHCWFSPLIVCLSPDFLFCCTGGNCARLPPGAKALVDAGGYPLLTRLWARELGGRTSKNQADLRERVRLAAIQYIYEEELQVCWRPGFGQLVHCWGPGTAVVCGGGGGRGIG